ncbi:Re/Si-specific NAD(P)(+) transhydrogenase subunit alpha [Corallincola spongiicola]|uniref:NAD(P) transhydrogenase subunit alpha n=1 Tax=Corallincola spongiicola TaxID=2520508 RepID=A0ABY1WP18_9GAMM|nr:Re/Si-specific NAD(P)(+) transhydrogenase subunit alpha [Corallincola spongiicola]TAA45227.1 Re/Si-specific NAD(P)(+) transhydrogenase subunit alpha [Corallincola spongiicola]
MKIGVPREVMSGEQRVALTPDTAEKLQKLGFELAIEAGAGAAASFTDDAYSAAGVEVITDTAALWRGADIIFKVNPPMVDPATGNDEAELLKPEQTLISFFWPAQNEDRLKVLAEKNINLLAMDSVPRISRAQSLDALSSMANISGYRAVVEAAHEFGRFFTGQITAAGKVPPAKVLVIGAGVAGLAAIGAAGSLGAEVRAFDTRPEVAEQIESMGGTFLRLDYEEEDTGAGDGYAKEMSKAFIEAEMKLFAEQAAEVDIIITTAAIPGRPAPKLILAEMVESMKPGSVIVDLAALTGGNCELTEPGEAVVKHDVTIIGYTDIPSRLPAQSSQLYGTNLVNLMKLLCLEKDGNIDINFDDEVLRGVTVAKAGEVTWPAPPIKVSAQPQQPAAEAAAPEPVEEAKPKPWLKPAMLAVGAGLFGWVAQNAPSDFLAHFTVFVLACVVGYYVVWGVAHALHTPLMSVTNAISGIIIVGGLVQMNSDSPLILALSGFAILIATINIVGGFTVTQRMLKMFQRD